MNQMLNLMLVMLDIWRGRFQCFVATTADEKKECIAVLEEVRLFELNRMGGQSVLDSHAFKHGKSKYRLMGCRDMKTNKVVGCLKVSEALGLRDVESSREEYHLDLFDDEMLKHMVIFTRLAVIPSYRKTAALLTLLIDSFQQLFQEELYCALISCEPNLYSMYERFGARVIGPLHCSPSGGHRIPMICIPERKHIIECRSPLKKILKHISQDQIERFIHWYREFEHTNTQTNFGFSHYSFAEEIQGPSACHEALSRGLTESGRKQLLHHAVHIHCKPGDVIMKEEDGGRFLGCIYRGAVEVHMAGDKVLRLVRGEVFGQTSFVLNHYRTARVVAVDEGTEVVLLSRSCVRNIKKRVDQVTIWRNLSISLGDRVRKLHFLHEDEKCDGK